MEDIADDEDAIPPLRKQNQMPDAGGPQPTRESALTEPWFALFAWTYNALNAQKLQP